MYVPMDTVESVDDVVPAYSLLAKRADSSKTDVILLRSYLLVSQKEGLQYIGPLQSYLYIFDHRLDPVSGKGSQEDWC